MSFLCVRVDLDYVPWDTPDAQQFGHGEPAMVLRLLELGRQTGARWHFFASERAIRAFPTEADAVLNDGHHLDYLAKHPDEPARAEEAKSLLAKVGHEIQGYAIRDPWPRDLFLPPEIQFLSGPESGSSIRTFPPLAPSLHEAVRQGASLRSWVDEITPQLSEGATVVISPQVLARVDPRLTGIRELLDFAKSNSLALRTLREIVADR